ncbi:MAG: dynamin family protein [Microbacterium pygmaeum]
MKASVRDDAGALIRSSLALYEDDPVSTAVLTELERRLNEPLRLALAGMVKAGKSTLLNAMLGEEIAPTDAGECTRIVTWYRYSATPSITLHPHDGPPRRMPVRREAGRLVLDIGDTPAEEVAWIDIGWPSTGLRSAILIDTPGIASLSVDVSERSMRFLVPEQETSSADAIVYLMRHLHASDLKFLESFRDTAAGASQTVNAVAVLSRADEIGSGRIDSMLSAGKVARRYERDGELSSLSLGVVPVAGLMAESARTLRESEFAAFRELARIDRKDRERLMVSADRFVKPTDSTTLSEEERRELLGRFGIFGVRLATAIVRGGAADSSELAEQLVQQSGLNELEQFVRLQFRTRAAALKVRGVLGTLERLLKDDPRPGSDDVLAGIERIHATTHTLRELSLLSKARSSGLPLEDEDAAVAERIIGGAGATASVRLGLPEDADQEQLRESSVEQLAYWRAYSQSPLTERASVEVARTVIRSLEEIASEVGAPRVGDPSSDVVSASGPGESASEGAEQESEEGERDLDQHQLSEEWAVLADGDDLQGEQEDEHLGDDGGQLPPADIRLTTRERDEQRDLDEEQADEGAEDRPVDDVRGGLVGLVWSSFRARFHRFRDDRHEVLADDEEEDDRDSAGEKTENP